MKQLIFSKKYIDPLLGKVFKPGDKFELENEKAEILVNSGYAKYAEGKNTELKTKVNRAPSILKTFPDYKEIDLRLPISKQIEDFKKRYEHIKTGEMLFYVVVQVNKKVSFLQPDDRIITEFIEKKSKHKYNNISCYIMCEMFWYH